MAAYSKQTQQEEEKSDVQRSTAAHADPNQQKKPSCIYSTSSGHVNVFAGVWVHVRGPSLLGTGCTPAFAASGVWLGQVVSAAGQVVVAPGQSASQVTESIKHTSNYWAEISFWALLNWCHTSCR